VPVIISARVTHLDRRHRERSTTQVISYALYKWFTSWEEKPCKKQGDDYEASE
jgi:hypothetical protein